MRIAAFPLGELQANCYFLINNKSCILVDPGDSADFILEEVSRNNLVVEAIIATHGHFDHVMAVGELQASLNSPFYLSEKDLFLLDRLEETAKFFLGHTPEILPIKKPKNLSVGLLQTPHFKLQVIQTPGHTPGSSCVYLEEERALLTGDTLFKDGIGRYDFSYSNKKQLINSIKRLIESLPADSIVYPGHGELSTLGEEKKNLAQFF